MNCIQVAQLCQNSRYISDKCLWMLGVHVCWILSSFCKCFGCSATEKCEKVNLWTKDAMRCIQRQFPPIDLDTFRREFVSSIIHYNLVSSIVRFACVWKSSLPDESSVSMRTNAWLDGTPECSIVTKPTTANWFSSRQYNNRWSARGHPKKGPNIHTKKKTLCVMSYSLYIYIFYLFEMRENGIRIERVWERIAT